MSIQTLQCVPIGITKIRVILYALPNDHLLKTKSYFDCDLNAKLVYSE